ncbi:hypothetical protein D3C75_526410 [compost metagenome]
MRCNRHSQSSRRHVRGQGRHVAGVIYCLHPVAVCSFRDNAVVIKKRDLSRHGHHRLCSSVPEHAVAGYRIIVGRSVPAHSDLFMAYGRRSSAGWNRRSGRLQFIQDILHRFAGPQSHAKSDIWCCRELHSGMCGSIAVACPEHFSGIYSASRHRYLHPHRQRLLLEVHEIQQNFIRRGPNARSAERRGVDCAEIGFFAG